MAKESAVNKTLNKILGDVMMTKNIGSRIYRKGLEHSAKRKLVNLAKDAESREDYASAGKLYLQAGKPKEAADIYEKYALMNELRGDYKAATEGYKAAGAVYPKEAEKYEFRISEIQRRAKLKELRSSPESNLVEMAKAAAVFLLFAGSFVFSSLGITGNASAQNDYLNSSILGAGFFILSIILSYVFWLKK